MPDKKPRHGRQNIECSQDLAQWLSDIAKHRTREMKDSGDLVGREQFGVARLIDPILRDWAWRELWKLQNPGSSEEDCPPAPPTTLDDERA